MNSKYKRSELIILFLLRTSTKNNYNPQKKILFYGVFIISLPCINTDGHLNVLCIYKKRQSIMQFFSRCTKNSTVDHHL